MVVGVESGPERKHTGQYHACHEDHEEQPHPGTLGSSLYSSGSLHRRYHRPEGNRIHVFFSFFIKEVAVLRKKWGTSEGDGVDENKVRTQFRPRVRTQLRTFFSDGEKC